MPLNRRPHHRIRLWALNFVRSGQASNNSNNIQSICNNILNYGTGPRHGSLETDWLRLLRFLCTVFRPLWQLRCRPLTLLTDGCRITHESGPSLTSRSWLKHDFPPRDRAHRRWRWSPPGPCLRLICAQRRGRPTRPPRWAMTLGTWSSRQ